MEILYSIYAISYIINVYTKYAIIYSKYIWYIYLFIYLPIYLPIYHILLTGGFTTQDTVPTHPLTL